MNTPAFFDEVAKLQLYDPLAEFLGAASHGLIEYGYADAVKLAGHSCPTVAGAYLMTFRALQKLYPDRTPERGAIQVEFQSAQVQGVTGVMASVASLLTGVAGEGGFKGLGGRFSRQNLLRFSAGIDSELRFTRMDTGAAASVAYHPEIVPAPPGLQELMPRLLSGQATEAERSGFRNLWQQRVKEILINQFDNPQLVVCT